MNIKSEWKSLSLIITTFILCFYLPIGNSRFDNALMESFHLIKWYAREHVILCLIPAFFIAGAISVFVSSTSVMKYLGAKANKIIAYAVASVSGSILAVCSCTVLPLFSGIYKMGAGLGPATAFLYSGPAINVLAIILTARVLGFELGIARAVGAIVFSIVIGLLMHLIFYKEEVENARQEMVLPDEDSYKTLWQLVLYFGSMIAILVFANFGKSDEQSGIFHFLFLNKWIITSIFAILFGIILILWYQIKIYKMFVLVIMVTLTSFFFSQNPIIPFVIAIIGISILLATSGNKNSEWLESTWKFSKQIMPLLFIGVLIAGLLLGRPQGEGLIPSKWIYWAVGGNSFFSNLFASIAGAFMYFATLTEIPILQGLIGNGMGKGPALALLLSGPALSLPNMLVIRSVMGTKKTIVYVSLVIVMATISGIIYGGLF
ncbi:MAG: permease [Pseudomonadota bacterium]